MEREVITLNGERDVTLTTYTQRAGGEFRRAPRRPAVLILPGGGYAMCSEREADPVAFAYLAAGFQAFVLRYSVGKHAAWPNPLDDYEQAMALIRSRADDWGIYRDKVAVVGFSAGGHLAGVAATSARERPNAAVLGYAALGGCGTPANTGAPAVASAVDDLTPPCFVFASASDVLVPVTNSIEFIGALAQAGISFESHIYAFAPHGFSTGVDALEDPDGLCSRALHWVADSVAWLGDVLGLPGEEGMGEPAVTDGLRSTMPRPFRSTVRWATCLAVPRRACSSRASRCLLRCSPWLVTLRAVQLRRVRVQGSHRAYRSVPFCVTHAFRSMRSSGWSRRFLPSKTAPLPNRRTLWTSRASWIG